MPGTCPESDWFASYAEHQLSDADEVWLRRHASRCEDCRRAMALVCLQAGREAADAVPAETQARVRSTLAHILEQRLRTTRRYVAKRRSDRVRRWFVAAASLLIASLITYTVIEQVTQTSRNQDPVVKKQDISPAGENEPDTRTATENNTAPHEDRRFVNPNPKDNRRFVPNRPPSTSEQSALLENPASKNAGPEQPDNQARPTRTVAKIIREHQPIQIMDPVGEISLQRKGEKKSEHVTGPVKVGEGDLLTTKGPSAFFVKGQGVVLEANTRLSLSRVKSENASWLTLHEGQAIVNSEGEAWWFASRIRTLNVEVTDGVFAIASVKDVLQLTALTATLSCKDESGVKTTVNQGESLVLGAAGNKASPVSSGQVGELMRSYRATRPRDRTLLYSVFDDLKEGPFEIREGFHSRARSGRKYNYFLQAATQRKAARIRLAFKKRSIPIGEDVTIRLRYRTNAERFEIRMPIENKKAYFQGIVEPDRRQQNRWIMIDIPSCEFHLINADHLHMQKDVYRTLQLTVTPSDMAGDASPYLWIDDLQIIGQQ